MKLFGVLGIIALLVMIAVPSTAAIDQVSSSRTVAAAQTVTPDAPAQLSDVQMSGVQGEGVSWDYYFTRNGQFVLDLKFKNMKFYLVNVGGTTLNPLSMLGSLPINVAAK